MSNCLCTNSFKERIEIEKRTVTQSALGYDEVWEYQETRWAIVKDIDLSAETQYQQIGFSKVEFEFWFIGDLSLTLKDYRFIYNSERYEPIKAPKYYQGISRISVRKQNKNVEE